MMKLTRFSHVQAFVERATPFLVAHEAHNNLLLGLCAELIHNHHAFGPEPPVMLTVENGEGVVLAALQTPPNNLILAYTEHRDALDLLASTLAMEQYPLPGVQGTRPVAEQFARLWAATQGRQLKPVMDLRIYQLTAVRPPAPAPGQMRRATEDDRPLLVSWFAAFHEEAVPEAMGSDPAAVVSRWLSSPNRFLALWDDGEPVALAGAAGPTPNGIRIGVVYTPPGRRRRGYASALVAALSQHYLDAGKRFCFLFTDLANPTANHIYQTIGYEPVVDLVELRSVS